MSDYQQGEDQYIGRQVRAIRARRGISQQVLADRVGVSRGAIAKYENGERPVDSRRTLLALAQALGVNVGDLTGHEQERLDPSAAGFHTAVPDIETVLWSQGNITDVRPPRSLAELATLAQEATRLRQDCDYAKLGPMLAPMMADSFRHVRDSDSEEAWDVHGVIVYGVASALRARGYHALAWTAAQETERAALRTGGTAALAATAYIRSHILLTRPGALPAALEQVEATAERLSSDVRTVGEIETCGMLHLQASLVTAAIGGDPGPRLAEASEQASRLEHAQPGQSAARNVSFGPANVALWRMSAAMERREPGEVLKLAPLLSPNDLPAEGRRAQYFVEIGRAHAMQRNYTESLHALLRAEHAAPQHVRNMPHVRELVGHMMRSARRDLTTGKLGGLAQRVGAIPA
ncbi:Transcriptional regulator, contains XRE-family HTH domain [Nocardia amikacinitolerans]|uniref:helix-turn-helix domain-containing protein n=1 Tax=Nocardia amikacinitolerans TaxID=756689 RepID=UPI000829EB13|nr:helix-turn-helix transcriptional regulator [Nocardia amikacinitolerans]MCP2319596.1 Transcriptional regulator, contains XRE-family HTH domain [Nocardia amikacinitolerans]